VRGGALPPALLAAALGLLLSFAPRKEIAPSLIAFVVVAIAASFIRLETTQTDLVFYGCWASIVGTALSIHIPKPISRGAGTALAVNAGCWAGLVIGAAGAPLDLAIALPWVLLCLPCAVLIHRNLGIGPKVVASWLVAVSLLAAFLPVTTPTPGYAGDHME
jgi:hypothetical protein